MMFVLLFTLAHAEEATFAGAAAPAEAPKSETKLAANLGGNFTAGNSEAVSVNAGFDLSHKWSKNKLGIVGASAIGFGAIDANADGFLAESERCIGGAVPCQPTTEKASADLRYDRFFGQRSSLYLLAGALHDKFGGFDLRSHGQLGYALSVVDTDPTNFKAELGADFANEDFVEGVEPNSQFLIAMQVSAVFDHKFNENVGFADTATVYVPFVTQPAGGEFAPSFADVRVGNTATISAKLSNKLSLNVSDTLAWRNQPIAPPTGITEQRSPFDNTLTVGLVASLL